MSQYTDEELLGIAKGMTSNMVVSMKQLPKYDYKVGRNSICTGLGKYTTMAFMGVCNGLEKRKLIEKVFEDERAKKLDIYHYEITPLGRAVADYITANWDAMPWHH